MLTLDCNLAGGCMNKNNWVLGLLLIAGSVLCACSTARSGRAERQQATSYWMIGQERAWAEMACGGKWIANDTFADDFKGTAPNGSYYGKPSGSQTYDPNAKWSTDCRLDDAEVRFFSPTSAVVFGKESKTVAAANGKTERRCLVWTDSWIRRAGKWQMIAVQDGRIDCPTK
jgi:Domain of unknown function (DUF4440)